MKIRTIILSRTDAIGDVVLTLPLANLLKRHLGDVRIIFFGKTYTRPVIESCESVDQFIDFDEFEKLDETSRKDFLKNLNADAIVHVYPRKEISAAARSAGIRLRIGATGRLHHWFNCNRLVRLSRKNSEFHEAQLNIKLLRPLGYSGKISLGDIPEYYSMHSKEELNPETKTLLSKEKFRLVLHPKSNASAREWSLENFSRLIELLPKDKFQIIVTGGEKEAPHLASWLNSLSQKDVLNLSGKLSLPQLISLLNSIDGIVAASTGPLHIASALGKLTLGIYPPIRPMHPGRWAPLGEKAEFIVLNKECSDCRFNPQSCHCMNEISPQEVFNRIKDWSK